MTETRYCGTCGALLSPGAVVCGECGARFQASPFDRKPTDMPAAWGAAPRPRAATTPSATAPTEGEPDVEIIDRSALESPPPGSTAMRAGVPQYDRTMAEQSSAQPSSAPADPRPAAQRPGPGGFDAPLDGCVPGGVLARLAAYLIDAIIGGIVAIPLSIGAALIALQGQAGLAAQILIGVGVVLPVLYALVLIWLEGSRGLTLGKAAMGLRTVRLERGGPIGVARALGRAVLLGIPVLGLIAALSVFADPRRTRRGLHDRAVGAVVLDVRRGRNGMKPRPDDFARAGAEHHLPAQPVAVSAHENLMASPGAPWGGADAPAPAPGWAAPPGGWDSPESARAAAHADDAAWAPPPTTSAPQATTPAAGPAVDASVSVGVPTAPPDPGQQGPADVAAGPLPPEPAAPEPVAPGPLAPEPAAPEPVAPVSPRGSHAVPAVTDADDEQEDEDEDRTRIARPAAPPVPRLILQWDDGTQREATPPLAIGRNPVAGPGEERIALEDTTRSVSKTHLRLEARGDRILVTDLGSTNGTVLKGPGEQRLPLVAQEPAELPDGARIAVGDRMLTVELRP